MLFGSYSINQPKEGRAARLHLRFKNGEMNFYACSVKFLEALPKTATGKIQRFRLRGS